VNYEDYQHLVIERRANGVVVLTLNRPEVLNAANERLHREIAEIWRTVGDDPDTRVAVVTGAGRAFSAGGDLGMIERNLDDVSGVLRTGREALAIVYNMLDLEKPIVSAINGVAVGAGLAVALMADISIIAESARLSDGHTRLGVASGDHSVMLWPLLCGMAKAKYHLLTADAVDGPEAERIGLVSMCVPDAELLDRAFEVADRLALLSQPAMAWTKRALNHWLRMAAPAYDLSVVAEMFNFLQPDAREGVRSLRERRAPVFPSAPPVGAGGG
jgi:enoyl-CoA hydratase